MNEFKTFSISGTTAAVVIADTGRNSKIHTINVPKTTVGTITVADNAISPVTQFVFPAGTINGSYFLDAVYANGLTVTTSSVSDTVVVSAIRY